MNGLTIVVETVVTFVVVSFFAILPAFALRRWVFRRGLKKSIASAVAALLTLVMWIITLFLVNHFLIEDGFWRGGAILWLFVLFVSMRILSSPITDSTHPTKKPTLEIEVDSAADTVDQPVFQTQPRPTGELGVNAKSPPTVPRLLSISFIAGVLLASVFTGVVVSQKWYHHMNTFERFDECKNPQPHSNRSQRLKDIYDSYRNEHGLPQPSTEETPLDFSEAFCGFTFGDLLSEPGHVALKAWKERFSLEDVVDWVQISLVFIATQVWMALIMLSARVPDSGYKRLYIVLTPILTIVASLLIGQEVRADFPKPVVWAVMLMPLTFWMFIALARVVSWIKAGYAGDRSR